jgi:hypothetical protein
VADAAAQATKDIQRADNSVLPVVLFAACLFFAGVTTRMPTIMGQGVSLTLGCILFVATVVWSRRPSRFELREPVVGPVPLTKRTAPFYEPQGVAA